MQLVAYWAPLNLEGCFPILPCHASLNRTCIILVCASCHVYACVFSVLLASFRCASLDSVGFVLELWGFVRLHPFVFFMDSFFFPAGFQARWPYPRNYFYLCFASCSFFCHAALPTTCYIMPPILPCQPLTFSPFLATVVWLCYRFAQPLLIALLVAGEDEDCSMLDYVYVGISQYLLYY